MNKGYNQMMNLRYHKWTKKDSNSLLQDSRNILQMENSQLFFPIMSLYFYIHNTKNSHKRIDFERNYYVKRILDTVKEHSYNSNIIVNCDTYKESEKLYEEKELFCKSIPLIDPIHAVLNNYNSYYHRSPFLPSNYSYNLQNKVNNIDNMAYIDVFCSYLFSELTQKDILPNFPIYYGSINGLRDLKYDITEEFYEFEDHPEFIKMNEKTFSIDCYSNDISDSENSSDDDSDKGSKSSRSSKSSASSNGDNYIANLKKCPSILLFMEKLEGTLEDIIQEDLCIDELKSCFFQIAFSLAYLQKHFEFTHNDLHINNIMYSETDKTFIYYKFNNIYYKIPTYGKIFKIIDFGRSILTFKKKLFLNDAFSKFGEAEGQYQYSSSVPFMPVKDGSEPSPYFDLCRLAITMLDEIRYNYDDEIDEVDDDELEEKYDDLIDFLKFVATDQNGIRLDKEDDNFKLYVKISKDAKNSHPREIITHEYFNDYRIKKNMFPKKLYYSLA